MFKKISPVIYFGLFVVLWDSVHFIFNINSLIIPSFLEIFKSFINNFIEIINSSLVTMIETVTGLVIAIIFSISLAILLNELTFLKKFVINIFSVIQIIPLVAIAPLIIIWFGIGISYKIFLVVIYSSFSIIITTTKAFENISLSHKLYIQTLTENKIKIYKYFYLPMCMPQIFSGIRIAVTYSVACAITGEYIGGKVGLGILLSRAYSSFQTDLVFAIIFVIIFLTLLLLYFTDKVENIFVK